MQSERTIPHACSPNKQRSRHSTLPDNTSVPAKLGLPLLSPKSPTDKEDSIVNNPVNTRLPSMHQRPSTKACTRENKKSDLLQWVNRPVTNAASDRLKRHRSFKTSTFACDPEPHQTFHCPMQKQPSLENLSVTTDGTFIGVDSPSMLSMHSVESDVLEWSRPHAAGHLTASPPVVPSPSSSTLLHVLHGHPSHQRQTIHSRPLSNSKDEHLPSITQKDRPGRLKKWHSERIKRHV